MSFGRLAVAVSLSALAFAGCGDATVETDSVESEIKKSGEASGVAVSKVECPDDIKAKKGSRVECDVTIEGAAAPVKVGVVQVDDDGRFNIEFPDAGAAEAGEEEATEEDAGAESGDDEQAITELLQAASAEPASLCSPEVATEQFIEQLGGEEGCLAASEGEEPTEIEVLSVEVDGDTATATTSDPDTGETTLNLVRGEDGGWLIDGGAE